MLRFSFLFSFKRRFLRISRLFERPAGRTTTVSDLLSRNHFELNYTCKAVLGCEHHTRYANSTRENTSKYNLFARHERVIQTRVDGSEEIVVNLVEYTPSEWMINVQQTEYYFWSLKIELHI